VTFYNYEGFAKYITTFALLILKVSVLYFVILKSNIDSDEENFLNISKTDNSDFSRSVELILSYYLPHEDNYMRGTSQLLSTYSG